MKEWLYTLSINDSKSIYLCKDNSVIADSVVPFLEMHPILLYGIPFMCQILSLIDFPDPGKVSFSDPYYPSPSRRPQSSNDGLWAMYSLFLVYLSRFSSQFSFSQCPFEGAIPFI